MKRSFPPNKQRSATGFQKNARWGSSGRRRWAKKDRTRKGRRNSAAHLDRKNFDDDFFETDAFLGQFPLDDCIF